MAQTYTAEIFGPGWTQGPICEFPTITSARHWAESYGTTAMVCVIHNSAGEVIARHQRNTAGDGTRWFRAGA